MLKQKNNQKGFALLMSLIVVGVVVSVGLTILDLSIKQLVLSSNSKDSEIALHAANAGLECAQHWRSLEASDLEDGNAVTFECFNQSKTISKDTDTTIDKNGDGNIYKYNLYDNSDKGFTWGLSGSERCSKITLLIMNSDSTVGNVLEIDNISTIMPGYVNSSKECEAGGRCAVISVQGYNKSCDKIGTHGTLQREVLLES